MELLVRVLSMAMSKLSGWSSSDLLSKATTYFPNAYTSCNTSNLAQLLFNIVMPIGLVLLIIYYCIDLMSKAAGADFTTEIFVRSLAKFIIGFALISNCFALCNGIITFGNSLVEEIATSVSGSRTLGLGVGLDYEDIIAFLMGETVVLSFTQLFNLVGKALAQLILNALMTVVVMAVAYSRAVKLIVYQIFLPLAIADIFGGGIYGGGVSHLKKILAAAMQYPIVYIICLMTVIFMNGVSLSMGNWVSYMGQIAMICIVVLSEVKKSANTASELFR